MEVGGKELLRLRPTAQMCWEKEMPTRTYIGGGGAGWGSTVRPAD